jgi:hypothetical protein
MTESQWSGQGRVVAVFPDDASARRAAERAEARGARDIAINDHDDEVRALVGEMREEIAESWGGPSVGLYTPEMARKTPGYTAAAALAGAILALPLGFIDADISLGLRLVIAAICGAVAGGTIGFLVGGFIAARRRTNEPLAEERGTVVGLWADNAEAVEVLRASGAIRIDVLLGEEPVDTVASAEASPKAAADENIPASDGP